VRSLPSSCTLCLDVAQYEIESLQGQSPYTFAQFLTQYSATVIRVYTQPSKCTTFQITYFLVLQPKDAAV